ITDGKVCSALKLMRDQADERGFFRSEAAGINCASGFITIDSDGNPHLEAHDREHRQRHCLPARWAPGATWRDALLLNTLLRGSFGADPDFEARVAFVSEICGVAALGCATKLKNPIAIIFHGPSAGDGKSQVLFMLLWLLPPSAVSDIPLTRFGDERM